MHILQNIKALLRHIMPACEQSVRNYVTVLKKISEVYRVHNPHEVSQQKIRLGIVGYGNLGKACEKIALNDEQIETVGIFSRRQNVKSPYGTNVYLQDDIFDFDMDVVLLCVGSQSDLEETAYKIATKFNTADSFDTHAKIPDYIDRMSKIAKDNDRLCCVAVGWDPGLFSLARALFCAVMPNAKTQTFWGKGVSQGHSEAIRRIDGVLDAKQYTVPKENALKLAREGKGDILLPRDKHFRECFIVAKEGADKPAIEEKIKNMPNYFSEYDTIVHFVDMEYFNKYCSDMSHGGIVFANGAFDGFESRGEFSLDLKSNPMFTAGVLVTYAKAVAKEYNMGMRGVKTVLDIPICDLLQGEWIDKVKRFV